MLYIIDNVKILPHKNTNRKRIRCSFFEKNETVLSRLFTYKDKPYVEYKKLLPQVFEKVGLPKTTKASWSQYAGCSCGCSPGFILTHQDKLPQQNIYVTVVMDEAEALKLMEEEKLDLVTGNIG